METETPWLPIIALLLAVAALAVAGVTLLRASAKTDKFERKFAELYGRLKKLESQSNASELNSRHPKSKAAAPTINFSKRDSKLRLQNTATPPTAATPTPQQAPQQQQAPYAQPPQQPQQSQVPHAQPPQALAPTPVAAPTPAPVQPKTYYLPVGSDRTWRMADFKAKPGDYTQFVAQVVDGKAEFSLYETNLRIHLLSRPTDYRSDFLEIEGQAGASNYTEIQRGQAVLEGGALWRLRRPLILALT